MIALYSARTQATQVTLDMTHALAATLLKNLWVPGEASPLPR